MTKATMTKDCNRFDMLNEILMGLSYEEVEKKLYKMGFYTLTDWLLAPVGSTVIWEKTFYHIDGWNGIDSVEVQRYEGEQSRISLSVR